MRTAPKLKVPPALVVILLPLAIGCGGGSRTADARVCPDHAPRHADGGAPEAASPCEAGSEALLG